MHLIIKLYCVVVYRHSVHIVDELGKFTVFIVPYIKVGNFLFDLLFKFRKPHCPVRCLTYYFPCDLFDLVSRYIRFSNIDINCLTGLF